MKTRSSRTKSLDVAGEGSWKLTVGSLTIGLICILLGILGIALWTAGNAIFTWIWIGVLVAGCISFGTSLSCKYCATH